MLYSTQNSGVATVNCTPYWRWRGALLWMMSYSYILGDPEYTVSSVPLAMFYCGSLSIGGRLPHTSALPHCGSFGCTMICYVHTQKNAEGLSCGCTVQYFREICTTELCRERYSIRSFQDQHGETPRESRCRGKVFAGQRRGRRRCATQKCPSERENVQDRCGVPRTVPSRM